jgi:hypothetical protein
MVNNEPRYFNIVRRNRWFLLQDATGVFWGVYSSKQEAINCSYIILRKWPDAKTRGIIPRRPYNEY